MLTARNEQLGREATEKLAQALAAEGGGEGSVEFRQLDIADHASVQRFADWAKAELGEIDVLINNAGMRGQLGVEDAANLKFGAASSPRTHLPAYGVRLSPKAHKARVAMKG